MLVHASYIRLDESNMGDLYSPRRISEEHSHGRNQGSGSAQVRGSGTAGREWRTGRMRMRNILLWNGSDHVESLRRSTGGGRTRGGGAGVPRLWKPDGAGRAASR